MEKLTGYDDIVCEFALCNFNLLDRVVIETVAQSSSVKKVFLEISKITISYITPSVAASASLELVGYKPIAFKKQLCFFDSWQ